MRADRQRGAALLLALLTAALAALSLLVGSQSTARIRGDVERSTGAALAQARDALLGRAVADDNRPGSLPCPALDAGGQVPLFVGNRCPSYVGRFPWKAMKTGELRDGHGELLWYALAPPLRDHQAAEPINAAIDGGLFSLDGRPRIAAVLIAPGPAQARQDGRPGNAVGDYLDGANAAGGPDFSSGAHDAAVNDRILAVTVDELFRPVVQRVLGEIAGPDEQAPLPPSRGLRRHAADNGHFPWADSNGDGVADEGTPAGGLPHADLLLPEWLLRNQWLAPTSYRRLADDAAELTLRGSVRKVETCLAAPCP